MKSSLILLILLSISNISYSQDKICYKQFKEFNFTAVPKVSLKVYQNDNNFLFKLFKTNDLQDQIILTNIDFDKLVFKNINLQKSAKCYIAEFGIYGSTYGANKFLIIYRDGYNWFLCTTNFPQVSLVDIDHDGVFEFKILRGVFKDRFFNFSSGLLVERKSGNRKY